MNAIDLKDRGAVVTGGARGIGFACAERLLASGASVTLWDRDKAALDEATQKLRAKGHVHASVVDVTDETHIADAARAAEAAMGKVVTMPTSMMMPT